MYNELRQILPRDFRSTLSGVRGYAEGALQYQEKRRSVLTDRDTPLADRREHVLKMREHVEQLSVVLFTYALYLRFLSGDEAIKSAVAVFESLNVRSVRIGIMELSRDSKYYNMGQTLATSLCECIQSRQLMQMFTDRCDFHEIAAWFRQETT